MEKFVNLKQIHRLSEKSFAAEQVLSWNSWGRLVASLQEQEQEQE